MPTKKEIESLVVGIYAENKTGPDVAKAEQSVKKVSDAAKLSTKDADQLKKAFGGLQGSAKSLQTQVSPLAGALAGLATVTGGLSPKIGTAASMMNGLIGTMGSGGPLVLGVGALAAGFGLLATKIMESKDRADAAKKALDDGLTKTLERVRDRAKEAADNLLGVGTSATTAALQQAQADTTRLKSDKLRVESEARESGLLRELAKLQISVNKEAADWVEKYSPHLEKGTAAFAESVAKHATSLFNQRVNSEGKQYLSTLKSINDALADNFGARAALSEQVKSEAGSAGTAGGTGKSSPVGKPQSPRVSALVQELQALDLLIVGNDQLRAQFEQLTSTWEQAEKDNALQQYYLDAAAAANYLNSVAYSIEAGPPVPVTDLSRLSSMQSAGPMMRGGGFGSVSRTPYDGVNIGKMELDALRGQASGFGSALFGPLGGEAFSAGAASLATGGGVSGALSAAIAPIGAALTAAGPALIAALVAGFVAAMATIGASSFIAVGTLIGGAIQDGVISSVTSIPQKISEALLGDAGVGGFVGFFDEAESKMRLMVERMPEVMAALIDRLPGLLQTATQTIMLSLASALRYAPHFITALIEAFGTVFQQVLRDLPYMLEAALPAIAQGFTLMVTTWLTIAIGVMTSPIWMSSLWVALSAAIIGAFTRVDWGLMWGHVAFVFINTLNSLIGAIDNALGDLVSLPRIPNPFSEYSPSMAYSGAGAAGGGAGGGGYSGPTMVGRSDLPTFHSGGVVGRLRAHAGMFVGGRRGLSGDEVPIVAQSGEVVVSRADVQNAGGPGAALAQGGGAVNIYVLTREQLEDVVDRYIAPRLGRLSSMGYATAGGYVVR